MASIYDKVKHNGKTVDRYTHFALLAAEARLGYKLTIVQGSYNTSVSASAGTHAGGGVIDLTAYDYARKVRVLRELGFAAWYRAPGEGPWSPHIHAILIGNGKLSSSAQSQVASYKAGRNGLSNNAVDSTWRPSPIRAFPKPVRTRGENVDRAINRLKKVPKSRPLARKAAQAALATLYAVPATWTQGANK